MPFCFVLSSLIRIFALNHWHIPQWRAGVTSREIINKRLLLFGTL